MKIQSFILIGLISIAHGFLSPFMKLGPNLHQAVTNKRPNQKQSTLKSEGSSRLTTFHGMPNPFWFAQTIDASKSRQQSVRPNERSQHFDGTKACSYPCQRVPYYLKFEHALIMNGLEREISSIMTSSAVNSKGFVDVGRCEGSCRKAEAQNIRGQDMACVPTIYEDLPTEFVLDNERIKGPEIGGFIIRDCGCAPYSSCG